MAVSLCLTFLLFGKSATPNFDHMFLLVAFRLCWLHFGMISLKKCPLKLWSKAFIDSSPVRHLPSTLPHLLWSYSKNASFKKLRCSQRVFVLMNMLHLFHLMVHHDFIVWCHRYTFCPLRDFKVQNATSQSTFIRDWVHYH